MCIYIYIDINGVPDIMWPTGRPELQGAATKPTVPGSDIDQHGLGSQGSSTTLW